MQRFYQKMWKHCRSKQFKQKLFSFPWVTSLYKNLDSVNCYHWLPKQWLDENTDFPYFISILKIITAIYQMAHRFISAFWTSCSSAFLDREIVRACLHVAASYQPNLHWIPSRPILRNFVKNHSQKQIIKMSVQGIIDSLRPPRTVSLMHSYFWSLVRYTFLALITGHNFYSVLVVVWLHFHPHFIC